MGGRSATLARWMSWSGSAPGASIGRRGTIASSTATSGTDRSRISIYFDLARARG
ncbi:hypothetical protein [Micromonospora sp. CA-111912]|uniref:hypothetical protein n=1 Tax=Micromonospora sp. CA-111912 TaxID=3239955 RepID=UPI003D8C023A